MANSIDAFGAFWSRFTLFAQTYLSENGIIEIKFQNGLIEFTFLFAASQLSCYYPATVQSLGVFT